MIESWRNSSAVRTQALHTLTALMDRYPNIRLGQLLADATAGRDLSSMDDADFGYVLNHLLVIYTQLEAAGLVRR